MTILDGKKTSNDIKNEIAISVKEIVAKGSRPPHLAAVIVGEDGASLKVSSPIKETIKEPRYLLFSFKANSHGIIKDGQKSWD